MATAGKQLVTQSDRKPVRFTSPQSPGRCQGSRKEIPQKVRRYITEAGEVSLVRSIESWILEMSGVADWSLPSHTFCTEEALGLKSQLGTVVGEASDLRFGWGTERTRWLESSPTVTQG